MDATQHYVVKLPKSVDARHYCPKMPRVPGTLGTRANKSPESTFILKQCFARSLIDTILGGHSNGFQANIS